MYACNSVNWNFRGQAIGRFCFETTMFRKCFGKPTVRLFKNQKPNQLSIFRTPLELQTIMQQQQTLTLWTALHCVQVNTYSSLNQPLLYILKKMTCNCCREIQIGKKANHHQPPSQRGAAAGIHHGAWDYVCVHPRRRQINTAQRHNQSIDNKTNSDWYTSEQWVHNNAVIIGWPANRGIYPPCPGSKLSYPPFLFPFPFSLHLTPFSFASFPTAFPPLKSI